MSIGELFHDHNSIRTWNSVTAASTFSLQVIPNMEVRRNVSKSFLSKGSWTLKDDTIVLNSFQPKECYYLQYFGDDCIAPPLIGDTSKYVERTSVKGCNPEYHRIYIMFYNERFILRNDTLIHILRTKYRCSDIIKNDFIKQK